MLTQWLQFFEKATRSLLPTGCLRCRQTGLAMAAPPLQPLCLACASQIWPNPCLLPVRLTLPHRRAALLVRSPYRYRGALVDLLLALKFARRKNLATFFANLICADNSATDLALQCKTVVPMPIGPRRLRQRGYNQAALLAHLLALRWNKPYQHLLTRGDTTAQSLLPLASRHRNVRNLFHAPQSVQGKVMLIDDVITSGASLSYAAHALLAAGASQVIAITVASANNEWQR